MGETKHTLTNMAGMGREELMRLVVELQSQVAAAHDVSIGLMKTNEAVMAAAQAAHAVLKRDHDAMFETCTAAQRTGTAQLEELRIYRNGVEPWVAKLTEEMGISRAGGSVNVAQLSLALTAVARDVYVDRNDGMGPGCRLAALAVRTMNGEHEERNPR